MKKDLGWLISIALALLALGRGLPALSHLDPASKSAATASHDSQQQEKAQSGGSSETGADGEPKEPKAKCGDGEQLIQQYEQLYWPTPRAGAPAALPARAADSPEAPARHFRYLIALVPDPEESGHTDYFDAVLDGIEDAAAAGSVDFWRQQSSAPMVRYVRDHYWLPWSGSDKQKRSAKCWEEMPGVILYRPREDVTQHPALVVLLVGETPTWGVRTPVLEAALRMADRQASQPPERESLWTGPSRHWFRILGPTFSGSAPSLRAALERYMLGRLSLAAQEPRPALAEAVNFQVALRVASGTATGGDVQATLNGNWAAVESADHGAAGLMQLEYESAVPTYDALLEAMCEFLADAGGSWALLSESSTVYGELPGPEEYRNERSCLSRLGWPGRSDLLFRFPPNLTSLRNAYTAVDPATSEDAKPRTRAPAAGEAPAEARGELSDQTPVTHDLALAEVLRELSQAGVRNIGISATDARDVIFMAERVGVQLPDVRLFTIGFDLRYLHPDHARVLNGLLVAHAAPEKPLEQSAESRNLMTQLVSAAGRHLLSGRPLEPRARVSLVGNGSLRQIADDLDAAGNAQPRVVEPPRSYQTTLCVTLLLLFAGVLVCSGPSLSSFLPELRQFSAASRERFLRRPGALHCWLTRLDDPRLAADDACARAGLMSLLLALPLMMAQSSLVPATLWLAWLPPGLGAALLIYAGARGAQRGTPCRSALGLAFAMFLVAAAVSALGASPARDAKVWILSGGSPLIGGLVCTGMLLALGWCWLARLRSLDLLLLGPATGKHFSKPVAPLALIVGCKPQAEGALALYLEQRLLGVLRGPCASLFWPVLLALTLLATFAIVYLLKPILTFETGFQGWVLLGVSLLSLLLMVINFAQLITASRVLLRLLRSLGRPRLLEALTRIPRPLAFRLENELVHARRGASELTHALSCLSEFAKEEREWAPRARLCEQLLRDQLCFEAGVIVERKAAPRDLVCYLLQAANELAQEELLSKRAQELADNYRASLVAIFLARYLQQLRSMVTPVVVGSASAVLITSLYFVQPRHLIATTCFLWVTAIALTLIGIYLALARDALLSAIGDTTAGAVQPSWALAGRIAAVTVVPLGSFIASQYPEFVFWLTSFFGDVAQFVQ